MVDLLKERGAALAPLLVAACLLAPACAPSGSPDTGGPGADTAAAVTGDRAETEPARSPARVASDRLVDRARSERRDGNLEVSASLLERAVRVDPSNGRAYLELAAVRSQQGRRDEALGLLERALELLRPGSPARARADSLRESLGGTRRGAGTRAGDEAGKRP